MIGTAAKFDGPVADIPYQGKSYHIPLKEIATNKFLFAPVADRFIAMREAAKKAGVTLKVNTAYRDMIYQDRLYKAYLARNKRDPEVARPGTSDHERGIAVDIDTGGMGQDSPVYKWLVQNCISYGFMNDVVKEPWHWTHKRTFSDSDTVVGGKIIRFDDDGKITDESVSLDLSPSSMIGLGVAGIGIWYLARPYLPGWAGGKRI
jgi:hypothetical protein